jgi:hypothetical protein
MRKLLTLFFVFASAAFAQTTHTATMSWKAPTDAIATSTYNVYYVAASCPTSGLGTLNWVKINPVPIVGLTYTQSGLAAGNYCWYVTQVQNGVESPPSTTAGGMAKPGTVTFSVTIN